MHGRLVCMRTQRLTRAVVACSLIVRYGSMTNQQSEYVPISCRYREIALEEEDDDDEWESDDNSPSFDLLDESDEEEEEEDDPATAMSARKNKNQETRYAQAGERKD